MNRARTTTWALLFVVPAAFAWACGGDDSNDGGLDSGGNDVTVGNDTGPGKDGSGSDVTTTDTGTNDTGTTDTGTTDGGTTDSGTTDTGADSGIDTGADSGLPTGFDCVTPSDCDAGFCCGTIVFNGGTIPNCNLADASSTCNATCNSNVAVSCNATDTVRSCVAHADCADAGSGYTDCCNVPLGDAAVEFCWNAGIAGLISGASCL